MKDIQPFFSVITPTFDRPELLKRAIQSLLSQSFRNFEYIIIDDGNNPGTPDAVKSFHDQRIVYFKHPYNKGTAAACNTGIKLAKGEFVCILGDDDEYLSGILQKFYDLFQQAGKEVDYVWTGVVRVRDTEKGDVIWRKAVWPEKFEDPEEGLEVASGIGSSFGLCIRRVCFDKIGLFDESFKVSEDTEFMIRLARNFEFRTIPEVLVKIHAHDGPQQVKKRFTLENWMDYKKTIQLHSDFIFKHKNVMHAHAKAYAMICYRVQKRNTGRKMYFQLIRRYPFNRIFYADLWCLEVYGKHFKIWKRERKNQ